MAESEWSSRFNRAGTVSGSAIAIYTALGLISTSLAAWLENLPTSVIGISGFVMATAIYVVLTQHNKNQVVRDGTVNRSDDRKAIIKKIQNWSSQPNITMRMVNELAIELQFNQGFKALVSCDATIFAVRMAFRVRVEDQHFEKVPALVLEFLRRGSSYQIAGREILVSRFVYFDLLTEDVFINELLELQSDFNLTGFIFNGFRHDFNETVDSTNPFV